MPPGVDIVIFFLLIIISVFQISRISKLKKSIAVVTASAQDLSFKINDVEDYLNNQLARMHFDSAQKMDCLKYRGESPVEQVVADPEAKKILEKFKLIKKRDKGPFPGILLTHAEECGVPIERLLIALNDRDLIND
jgi:hypothetical protein